MVNNYLSIEKNIVSANILKSNSVSTLDLLKAFSRTKTSLRAKASTIIGQCWDETKKNLMNYNQFKSKLT